MVDETRYLGITIDRKLAWLPHIKKPAEKCSKLYRCIIQRTKSYYGPKPKLQRWVYTSIIRPKISYAALTWVPYLDKKGITILKKLNRLACMSLTPTTRSTPQASLEIMYNIAPIDLILDEIGLNAFLRLRGTLPPTRQVKSGFSHLDYWEAMMEERSSLMHTDDYCNETRRHNLFQVNLDSMKGGNKHIQSSEVTVYTDGSKMKEGT